MMLGSYNTIRPRKPISGFNFSQEEKNAAIFKIDDFNKRKSRPMAISMPTTGVNHFKPKKKSLSAPVTKKFLYQVENYCDKTTLHGLKYVGDPTLSLCERLFWFCSFGIAACLAGYFISNIYIKWSESPVIISFSPSDADLNSIPFPSITICNMNQAKRHEAERIVAHGSPAQKKLLGDYCNLGTDVNQTEYETDWDTMQNFLITVGQSCNDMLKSCSWKNERVDCDDYFNNDLTDEGLCCSFNRLPPDKIYWNPKSLSYLNQTYSDKIYDWNPEDGFPDKQSEATSNYIPRRPLGAGQHLGLTITLDTQVDNYYCSSTYSVGFKIVLSNPIETPKTADFGFLLSPGVEARYVIDPVIREATDSLRNVAIEKRQCYFSNERSLQYYRSYTMNNCYSECQSNYTLKKCGCIPYYLPQSRGKRVCVKRDQDCVIKSQEDTNIVYGRTKTCDCLPGCSEISFKKSGTASPLTKRHGDKVFENYTLSSLRFLLDHGILPTDTRVVLDEAALNLSDWKIPYLLLFPSNSSAFIIRTYSERNCRLECISNYTKEMCDCIPYFLPKAKDVTTCSKKQAICQDDAKSTIEIASKKGQKITAKCNCLPGCYEVRYLKTGTYSSLKIEYYRNVSFEEEEDFKKNTAIAHFFFENSKFSKQIKSEVFGFTDVVSSCGGLLGLFVGFSLLSLIEFVYFATLRLLCKRMRRHRTRPSLMSRTIFK